MDAILNYDQWLLLAVNGSHTEWQDALWYAVSSRVSWILIALAFVLTLIQMGKLDWRRSLLTLGVLALSIVLADQVASGWIKHLVERPRPTHTAGLAEMLHIVNGYRGGMYGFVSSHAANSFAVALLVSLIFRRWHVSASLFLWAALQCYSRVYLGVHYPTDILGGMLVGFAAAGICYAVYRFACQRIDIPVHPNVDGRMMSFAVLLTLICILVVSFVNT